MSKPIKYRKKAPYTSKNNLMHKIAKQEAKKVVAKEIEVKNIYQYSNPGAGHGFVNVGASTATGALAQNLLAGMEHGLKDQNMIGDKIKPAYIKINYAIKSTSTDNFNLVRLIVVQVIGGGVANIDNVLLSTGNNATPLSPYDPDYRETYRVLYDSVHDVHAYDSFPGSAKCTKTGSIFIPGKKLRQVHFLIKEEPAMAVAAGNLIFFAVSDSTSDPDPQILYWTNVGYTDA